MASGTLLVLARGLLTLRSLPVSHITPAGRFAALAVLFVTGAMDLKTSLHDFMRVPGGVEVTPDGGSVNVDAYSSSGEGFFVKNTRTVTTTYTLSCAGFGGVTCTGMDTYSVTLASQQSTDVYASYTTGAAGSGSIVVYATGAAADSGYVDLNITTPAMPATPDVSLMNQNGGNIDRGDCLTVGAGEDAGLSCGDLFVTKALPAYRTLGRDRSLGLLYNSATSSGLVLVAANVTPPAGSLTPNSVKVILTVGSAKDSAMYLGMSPGATQQIVIGRNITGLATGVYDATLQVQSIFTGTVLDKTLQTRVIVVNRSASEFGKGWGLLGLEQVLTDPTVSTRRLWVTGDGSARVYHRGIALTSGMLSHSGMSNFIASSIVDGNPATQGWHTDAASAGAWLRADLGTAQEVTTVGMYTDSGAMYAVYDIQYSDNNSTWTTAFGNFRPVTAGWRQVTWESVGAHRYWRIHLNNTPGPGAWMNELSFGGPNTFYGAPGDAPDSLVWTGSGYLRNLKHGTVVAFDANGRHITTTNRFGAYTTFNWGTVAGQPRLASIVIPPNDASPRPYYFYWNGSTALLDSVRDPGNRGLRTVMSSGLLTRLTDAEGLATRYSYAGTLLTKQVYVRKGMKGDSAYTTYGYANNARVTSIGIQTDSAASVFATTTVTPWDERGLAATYGSWSYGVGTTADGLATRVDGPISGSNDATDFWVNRMGQPAVTVQVGLSAKTRIWYDSTQTMPLLVTRVQYPHATTPGAGGRTVYMSWNPRGNLMEVRDSTCRKLAGCTPAQVNTTTYQYNDPTNAPDSPTRVIDALGRYTDYAYNSLGVVDSITDPRAHRTRFWHKGSGLFKGLVDSIAELQVETWNKSLADTGFVLTNQVVRFEYNANGLVTRTTNPLGAISSYVTDTYGRTTETYDPLRARRRYTFDVLNRVTGSVQDSAAYNHPGGLADPLAGVDTFQILRTDPTQTPGVGPNLTTNTWYGAAGVDSVKDPRGVYRGYVYDARGNLVRELDAFRNAKIATYDVAGLLTQTLGRVNPTWSHQDTVKYTYDGMGRLTKFWYNRSTPPSPYTADTVSRDSTRYTYDQLGQVLTAINRHGTIRRTYYADGSLRTQTAVYGGQTDSASYEYDASGARTVMNRTWVPSGGSGQTDVVSYSYAPSGDLSSITATWGSPGPSATTVNFVHDGLGRRHRLEYPNNVRVHFRYDAGGLLRRQQSVNPQISADDNLEFTYTADSVDATGKALRLQWVCGYSNIGSPCGTGPTTKTTSSRFNRYGWMVNQTTGGVAESFTYDKSGNRTSWLKSSGNRYYRYHETPYASNVLILDSAATHTNSTKGRISNNANGARVFQYRTPSGGGGDQIDKFFYYDGMGRIAGARDHSVTSSNFIDCNWYDPDGKLFVSCDGLGSQRQVFDGANVASLVDDRWVFISGPGVDDPVLGLYRPPTGPSHVLYYYVTDGSGRQLAIAKPDGSFSATDSDYIEGAGGKYAGGTANAQSYSASRMEAPANAPGISYFRNRAYDQATGRWLQEDPIGVAGGVNLYQFNGNNPVAFTDPFGLSPCKDANGNTVPCPEPAGGPPIPVPDGKDGKPNSWEVKSGSGKRTKWGPKTPVPSEKGEQPSGSWDPDGHWDIKGMGGRNNTRRFNPDGTEIGDHDGTPIYGPQQWPTKDKVDAAGAAVTAYLIVRTLMRFAVPVTNAIPAP